MKWNMDKEKMILLVICVCALMFVLGLFVGRISAHNVYYGETAAFYSNGEVTNAWIELEVDGEYPGAGTYTDTLTFTVELS